MPTARSGLAPFVAMLMLVGCTSAGLEESARARDAAAIRARLDAWPQHIADRELDIVCDLFSRDVVLSFSGQSDLDYDGMRARFARAFADDGTTFLYDRPDIQEILVDRDLAVVRLVWTLHVTASGAETVEKERGVDLFQREADGVWRIRISHAFPVQ